MAAGVERNPFMAALALASVSMLFTIISISTTAWTEEQNVNIGLWTITDNGVDYSWTNKWEYSGDFFYSDWMMAVRGLMMSAIILGGMAIFYNIYVLVIKTSSMAAGKFLTIYYTLTGFLLLCSAAVYCSCIPQEVVNSNGDVVDYIYRGSYGYSVWFSWIAGGVFLPAAALSYEATNQARKEIIRKQLSLVANENKSAPNLNMM